MKRMICASPQPNFATDRWRGYTDETSTTAYVERKFKASAEADFFTLTAGPKEDCIMKKFQQRPLVGLLPHLGRVPGAPGRSVGF